MRLKQRLRPPHKSGSSITNRNSWYQHTQASPKKRTRITLHGCVEIGLLATHARCERTFTSPGPWPLVIVCLSRNSVRVSRNSGDRPAQRSFFHGHEIPVCPSRNDGVCVTKFRTSSADGPRAHPGPSEIARDWGRDCNLATRSLQPSTPPPCLKPTGSFNCCVHAYHVTVIATTDNCHRYRIHRNRLLCMT